MLDDVVINDQDQNEWDWRASEFRAESQLDSWCARLLVTPAAQLQESRSLQLHIVAVRGTQPEIARLSAQLSDMPVSTAQ